VHLLSHPDFAVTISVGVTSSGPGDTLATLLERADAALYDAKHSGRNRVVAAAAIIPDLVH
jgi:diguanylate cyclase (GGDEF)-like protein